MILDIADIGDIGDISDIGEIGDIGAIFDINKCAQVICYRIIQHISNQQ